MRSVSIVMPVFNERATIATIIERVQRAPVLGLRKDVVVVDDGSSDGTREYLHRLAGVDGVTCVFHPRNRGKGAALRTGFGHARGDIVVVQDADLEYAPEDLEKLLRPIVDGAADVVFGSRFRGDGQHRVPYFWHALGNRVLTRLSDMCTRLNLTDVESGSKAFTRDVIRRIVLEEDGFAVEPEIAAKVARLGCRVHEVGISYAGRTYGEGKKITWRDGVRAVWCIFKYR